MKFLQGLREVWRNAGRAWTIWRLNHVDLADESTFVVRLVAKPLNECGPSGEEKRGIGIV